MLLFPQHQIVSAEQRGGIEWKVFMEEKQYSVLSATLCFPLEEKMATHFSILSGKFPWTEEPDRLQSMGSQSDMTEHTHTQVLCGSPSLCGFWGPWLEESVYFENCSKMVSIKDILWEKRYIKCISALRINYYKLTWKGFTENCFCQGR